MPPWQQQGLPGPAVTHPTGLETWLSQPGRHVTSGGGGGAGTAPAPGASTQPAAAPSSGVHDSRGVDQTAALHRLLASTYSPRWPPPSLPAVPRHESGRAVGYSTPQVYPPSTVSTAAAIHLGLADRWPLQQPPLGMLTDDRAHVVATPQMPVAAYGDALADTGSDEYDPIPLTVSDLDPRYQSQMRASAEAKREEERQQQKPPQAQAQTQMQAQGQSHRRGLSGGLAVLSMQPAWGQASQKQESNGAARDKASRKAVLKTPTPAFTTKRTVAATAAVTKPHPLQRLQSTTPIPIPTSPLSFSIPIPAVTPRTSGKSGDAQSANVSVVLEDKAQAGEAEKKPAIPGTLPVVAVGRRSKTLADIVQIKGRPKGWKPGMSYREVALRNAGIVGEEAAAILLPLPPQYKRVARGSDEDAFRRRKEKRPRAAPRSESGNGSGSAMGSRGDKQRPNYVLAKRSGRAPIPPTEAIQRTIFLNSPATFMPFVCEWAECRAELQNMATLRRHVMVVHGRTATTCRWRRCASKIPAVLFLGDGSGDVGGGADAGPSSTVPDVAPKADPDREAKRMDAFREHMEYSHLAPVEWHQGDGFVNNSHLGPPVLAVSLSTLSAQSKAIERAATAAETAAAETAARSHISSPFEHGSSGDKEQQSMQSPDPIASMGGDDDSECHSTEKVASTEAGVEAAATAAAAAPTAASTPFASYNVPPEDLPRYLLDEQGKQVTPLLRDPLREESTAFRTPEERLRRLKKLYRRPDRGCSRFA